MVSKKKPPAEKRAALPLTSDYTKQFLKDWSTLSRTGRFDMKRLKEAMIHLVANDEPLGPEWLDHELKGPWIGNRECHIGGDFLLIYRANDENIVFVRTGTHAELFE